MSNDGEGWLDVIFGMGENLIKYALFIIAFVLILYFIMG